ncbi:hypothetical protein OO015_08365 [Thermomicrobium sp. 4228-Ro]|uniref:hypothetical protein n=1 Tax=Thermomicrobium sp. 4228-Ro TaxID=2993937 RepID=UPI002248B819|nr:hypothetical protein [Thermomicrobium sp. 4228-Ro]MCX2727506.1 hypothetical protein [Thermomicrobium sp. 4228-Ro]
MEAIDVGAVIRILLRLIHAVSAAVWLGAGAYLVFALLPLRRNSSALGDILRASQRQFRRWWVASSALLLGSGVALMFDRLADGRGTAVYVGLLIVKVGAGLVALAASGGLLPRPAVGRSDLPSGFRLSGRVVLVLGAVAYLLGVLLSVIYPPDPTAGWR